MTRTTLIVATASLVFTPLLAATTAIAQSAPAPAQGAASAGQSSQEDLARQLTNPVASLVSVPFQFNWDSGVGPDDDTRFMLNAQPVVPFRINDDWNMILRWIMPYLSQPPLAAGQTPDSGMGDIVASVFFSPAKVGRFVWGVGPVFSLPTTAKPVLGSEKWSIGPTVVILKQRGPWTYGALANQLWSFAGDDERQRVNSTLLQPFLSYTTPNAVTYAINAEATANWEAANDQTWTVPINVSIAKLTRFGSFPMSVSAGLGGFVTSPDGGPSWRLRVSYTLLLPVSRPQGH